MSFFEVIMLLCFGSAWPFSIYKSASSRSNKGKSLIFLVILFLGYVAGSIHKIVNDFDMVTYLYITNGLMVLVDTLLYFRNSSLPAKEMRAST